MVGKRRLRFFVLVLGLISLLNPGCGAEPTRLYPAWTYAADGAVKWGYIDPRGRFVIAPTFDAAADFQPNGLAVVERGGYKGLIDRAGKPLTPFGYKEIRSYSEGRAVAEGRDGCYRVLDERGRSIYESAAPIDDFHDGLAVIQDGTLYGYIDRDGGTAIKPRFMIAGDFTGGKALVQPAAGGYALIDKKAATLVKFNYGHVSDYAEGFLVFKGSNGKYGYLDEQGRVIAAPRFDRADPFTHGLAVVEVDWKVGAIDKRGRVVIDPVYDGVIVLGEQLLAVGRCSDPEIPYSPRKYALAGMDGRLLTDFLYYDVRTAMNGLIAVTDYTSSYLLTSSGRRAADLPVIQGFGNLSFDGTLVKAEIDHRLAYYNRQGEVVWRAPGERAVGDYLVVERKFRPNRYVLVYYPQIEGMDQSVQESVNERLRALAVGEYGAIRPETEMEFDYYSTYRVSFHRSDLLVMEFTSYLYPFGAAHGMPGQTHVHLNLKTGRFYALADLFRRDSDFAGVIGGIVRGMIERAPADAMLDLHAYKGVAADQPFHLTQDALVVYFHPYEIAPYAAGFPAFAIPYSEIMPIIDTDGELWRLIASRNDGK